MVELCGAIVSEVTFPLALFDVNRTEHPEIVLHDRDNSHPAAAGTYLATCVFLATLFRTDPVGLPTDIAGH